MSCNVLARYSLIISMAGQILPALLNESGQLYAQKRKGSKGKGRLQIGPSRS